MNAEWLVKEYLSNVKGWLLDQLPDPLLEENRAFLNCHQGERCFILGSGPSIKEQDMKLLAGQIVMTQNHFHAHEDIKTINPKYHVNVPKYQPKEYDNDWRDWLRSMDERLPAETTLFFGKNTRYLVDEMGLFQGRVHYIEKGGGLALRRRAPVGLTKRIMPVPTVLTECLAIAIYMGFSEIVLVGFDLDQVCRMNDRSQLRFYGLSPITANKAEQKADDDSVVTGYEWFNMWIIWKQLILLKDSADRSGIRIINATRGGLLNMFPREDYEDLV